MSRKARFVLIYIPSAIACWGVGHLVGIHDGTNGSLAAGYGGGLAVTVIVLLLRRRWAPAVRVKKWRQAAAQLRLEDPAVYGEILAQSLQSTEAAEAAARDPDAYVALFLSYADEEGVSLDSFAVDDSEMPTWPFEVLGVPVGSTADDVRRAYRALVQRFHPDHNPDDASARERFLAVQAAYEELGSP